jgi:hypothetical protein
MESYIPRMVGEVEATHLVDTVMCLAWSECCGDLLLAWSCIVQQRSVSNEREGVALCRHYFKGNRFLLQHSYYASEQAVVRMIVSKFVMLSTAYVDV